MDVNLFDFQLPDELIAQKPVEIRDHCKLMVIDYANKTIDDKHFYDIYDYFKKGDVIVRNNTKVIPARLLGIKQITNAKVEILLLKQIEENTWECLTKPAKSLKVGAKVDFGEGKLVGEIVEEREEGIRIVKFSYKGIFFEVLDEIGKMPLPPYIEKQLCDNEEYQTVYAKFKGSAAAPTAGFHFTDELNEKLRQKGVEILEITLHIGLGTFRPIIVADTNNHVMHSETYNINPDVAERINLAKKEHRRVIAVGTTTIRTLEANASKYGMIQPTHESTNIFITPGYQFKIIDAVVTNFHLPKSTLIMLVSAFMDREFTLNAYQHAIENKYKFFSFGDAMFIYGK